LRDKLPGALFLRLYLADHSYIYDIKSILHIPFSTELVHPVITT